MKKQEAIEYLNQLFAITDSDLLLTSFNENDEIPEYFLDFLLSKKGKSDDLNIKKPMMKKVEWDIGDAILANGRIGEIVGEENGQGGYSVTFETPDGLGMSEVVQGSDMKPYKESEVVSATESFQSTQTTEPPQQMQAKYPLTKDGEPDVDAMDNVQLFDYNAEIYGMEQAIADYRDDITFIEEEIIKLNEKISKAKTAKEQIKLEQQIEDLDARKSNLQTIINQNTQQNAIKKESIIEGNQPERGGVAVLSEVKQTQPIKKTMQFPTLESGEIDYAQIHEPAQYAKALMQEFGKEATSIVDELILEQQELLSKAEEANTAIERIRKVKAITAEINKLTDVRLLLPKGKTEPAKINHFAKAKQSELINSNNSKSSSEVNNIIAYLKSHKILTSIGLVLLLLMLSNPSNSRYADFLRANGKPLNLKEADGYYGHSVPQWGKDQNYLFFSIFKYHTPSDSEITHIGLLNNFYLMD